jgi:1-deoxy-D-xylulose-5-phosphate synthase
MALANLNNPETIAHYDFAFVKPLDEKELHTILKPLKRLLQSKTVL